MLDMGNMAETKLPESVQEIADVIGREEALAFIGQLPQSGSRSWRRVVYIPKTLPVDHDLVRQLGWENAQRMVEAFSGMILQPSNCQFLHRAHRKAEIWRMHTEGVPDATIADIVELSKYYVREIILNEQRKREAEGHE